MDKLFYYRAEGQENGPCGADSLRELLRAGTLQDDTPVRAADSGEWQRAGDLFGGLPPVPSQSPVPPEPAVFPAPAAAPVMPDYTLASAFLSCMMRYARFHGRAGRQEFWLFVLASAFLMGAAGVVSFVCACGGHVFLFLFVLLSAFLLLLPPLAAVACRRLHDAGKTGLLLCAFVGTGSLGGLLGGLLQIVLFVCAIICLVAVFSGSDAANRFGKAPEPPLDMLDVELRMTRWKREPLLYGLLASLVLGALGSLFLSGLEQEEDNAPGAGAGNVYILEER